MKDIKTISLRILDEMSKRDMYVKQGGVQQAINFWKDEVNDVGIINFVVPSDVYDSLRSGECSVTFIITNIEQFKQIEDELVNKGIENS